MIGTLKKLNKEAILEVAFGLMVAVLLLNLLGNIFQRGTISLFHADGNAEDLENLHGRGRARRAARRSTRRKNRYIRRRDAIRQGTQEGRAGEQQSVFNDEEEQEQEEPEMAEYYNNLSAEDIDNMDDAEYAEYLDYLEMADAA